MEKILHSNKKQKSNHPMSDVMSECRANMDLSEQLLVRLFPKNTLPTSSVILPLMPLLCIIVKSHGHKSAITIMSHFYMTIQHQLTLHGCLTRGHQCDGQQF